MTALDVTDTVATIIARHQHRLPIDPVQIAVDLGIKVYYDFSMSKNVAGKIRRVKEANARATYEILVNARDHQNRQRFTVAHELAHYILHRDLIGDEIVDDALYRSSLGGHLETQANRLAADIILPASQITRMLNDIGNEPTSVPALAAKFNVSEQAMSIRLKELSGNLAPKDSHI